MKKFEIQFPKGFVHGVCQKMATFHVCFFRKIRQKLFGIILDRIECFLDKKNKVFKKLKNSKFSKGVSPWFLSKNGHFPSLFFFLENKQEKSCFYNLDKKILLCRQDIFYRLVSLVLFLEPYLTIS